LAGKLSWALETIKGIDLLAMVLEDKIPLAKGAAQNHLNGINRTGIIFKQQQQALRHPIEKNATVLRQIQPPGSPSPNQDIHAHGISQPL